MINLVNKDLIFDEKRHAYTLNGRVLSSVTTFLSKFFDKFDRFGIAYKLSISDKYKDMGKTMQDILDEWDASAEHGTLVHKEIEDYLNGIHFDLRHPKTSQAIVFINRLKKNYPDAIIYPELRICSNTLGIAGTIDCLAVIGNKFIIMDWKTNDKLTDKGFNGRMGIHELTKNMEDCHISKYGLQLQAYAHVLETEHGLEPKELILVHLTDTDYAEYIIRYDRELIKKILMS